MDYEKFDKELATFDLVLEDDPIIVGIGNLSLKIARSEAVLDRIAQIYGNAISNHLVCEESYKTSCNDYTGKLQKLLVEDKEVKEQKSQEMRAAVANMKYLSEEVKDMFQKELDLNKAKNFKEKVIMYYERWNKKAKSIDTQLDVIREQIKIGEVTEESVRQLVAGRVLNLKKKE